VFERKDLLNSNLATRRFVRGGNNSAICTFTDGMQNLIVVTYDEMTELTAESIDGIVGRR
jgi:hypothetical protein